MTQQYLSQVPATQLRMAFNRTWRLKPVFAKKLFGASDSMSCLIGPAAKLYGPDMEQLFDKHDIAVANVPSPVPGCQYFDVPLASGEGLTEYCRLETALGMTIADGPADLWAVDTRLGYRLWTESCAVPSIRATCVRFVIGNVTMKPVTLLGAQHEQELIVWDWFTYNPIIGQSLLTHRCNNYDELITLVQASPQLSYVRQKRFNVADYKCEIVHIEDHKVIEFELKRRAELQLTK
jgi:hypothetical protein